MTKMANFQDFNFKLAVIQKLMYEQDVLTPRFDVYEFVKNEVSRPIDIEEEGYAIIPEVKQYFEQLEIAAGALLGIEQLYQDGGDDIYLQLCPLWDGEDDIFNIQSVEDAALLPNLKAVTLFYGDGEVLEAFEQRGITAVWL